MRRILAIAITGLLTAGTAHAVDPAVKCEADKLKEVGKYGFCLTNAASA